MRIYVVGLGCALILLLPACNNINSSIGKGHKADSPYHQNSAPAEVMRKTAGSTLFAQKCSSCHGDDGTAGISNASDLQRSVMDSLSMVHTITNGRGVMPAFKEQLTAAEIGELSSYLMILRNKK